MSQEKASGIGRAREELRGKRDPSSWNLYNQTREEYTYRDPKSWFWRLMIGTQQQTGKKQQTYKIINYTLHILPQTAHTHLSRTADSWSRFDYLRNCTPRPGWDGTDGRIWATPWAHSYTLWLGVNGKLKHHISYQSCLRNDIQADRCWRMKSMDRVKRLRINRIPRLVRMECRKEQPRIVRISRLSITISRSHWYLR